MRQGGQGIHQTVYQPALSGKQGQDNSQDGRNDKGKGDDSQGVRGLLD